MNLTHEEQVTLLDQYVTLDSKIKRMEKVKEDLRHQIISLGEGSHRGNLGAIAVAAQTRRTLSSDKVAQVLSAEELEACMVESTSVMLRVTAYNAGGA